MTQIISSSSLKTWKVIGILKYECQRPKLMEGIARFYSEIVEREKIFLRVLPEYKVFGMKNFKLSVLAGQRCDAMR